MALNRETTRSTEMERFVRLLATSEHEVNRYIYALVPNPDDAQDVFQETAVALWRHFGEYDPSRSFIPWACRFAYYEVLNFRKRNGRTAQWLDDEVVAQLAEDRLTVASDLNYRRDALAVCVAKLPPDARELVDYRYHKDLTVQEIARQTGRSANVLYKAFDQVRRWLAKCVERTLAAGGDA